MAEQLRQPLPLQPEPSLCNRDSQHGGFNRPTVSAEASVRIGTAIADAVWRSVYGVALPVVRREDV